MKHAESTMQQTSDGADMKMQHAAGTMQQTGTTKLMKSTNAAAKRFNPYRLDHGDNPSISLVSDLLTTDNYTIWSRAMCRALRAKNKLGFINGSLLKPKDPADPLLDAWERCNDLVVSWIQNSISQNLKSSIALVDYAKQIWEELKDIFTHENGPRIFQLKKALVALQQDQDSVSTYYGKLKSL
ncbi:hypothetical protein F2P56_004385 [Juglans regia]|uniref:Retrotransposon Copia-like N-terminal domain-containing protein n=1 Tax=Juglans regia TaxID=51240 RepID=A0A834D806_JUGRE|nr:hypothetical protein F2P56_004385 [Juglans regia]